MQRRLTLGLAVLRVIACGALVLLIWNPVFSRPARGDIPPLVLLDASLSMAGHGGRWREALDSAGALARGGVIWRFGSEVAVFDSAPPGDGATRLAPALEAAVERGGSTVVVTDGELSDVASIAPDLLERPRIVVLDRPPFRDAFVAGVDGPHRVMATDTIRLAVTYGTAGARGSGLGSRDAILTAELGSKQLAMHKVTLPDSGIVASDLVLPAASLPSGWSALEVRLRGAPDSEPRDDARLLVVEVSAIPSVVVLAAPPDWDLRFLARTLADVARVPLRMFIVTEPGGSGAGGGHWRDAATLAPVALGEVKAAVAAARLVVLGGDPALLRRFAPPASSAQLYWPTVGGDPGDWYVDAPLPSPLAQGLAGVVWDSLPPVASLVALSPDSSTTEILTARRARRGEAAPLVIVSERGAARRAEIAATGLYRWAFRGGASAEAYRALVAGLADWLLGEGGSGKGERATPVALAVPNGDPVEWRWAGEGAPRDVVAAIESAQGGRRDTLRFGASGLARLRLAPGVYRYSLEGGTERGMVAVETYSDEWRPARLTVAPQPGARTGQIRTVSMRERWWLFAVAIAAFAAEWAWRRRQGLP